jgi:ribose transport system substrate-binding protein
MGKPMIKKIFFLAVTVIVTALAGTPIQAKTLKGAIVVMDLTSNAFQIAMADQAVKQGKEAGVEVARYAPEGSFGDYAGQIAIIENLITQKVDFIILVAGHPKALVPVVSKAMAAGVAVVNIDNRLDTTDVVAYVGVDNGEGGKMAVDYIAKKLGGQGKIALIQGETGNPVQILRTMGFDLGAAVHPGLKVVARQGSHWTEDHGLEVMTNILQANPDLDAVFCESDNLAVGSARAVSSANSGKKVLIVGYDGQDAGYRAIKDGSVVATIRMDAAKMVGLGIKYAMQYVNQGNKKDGIPAETYLAPEVVDNTNVSQYLK